MLVSLAWPEASSGPQRPALLPTPSSRRSPKPLKTKSPTSRPRSWSAPTSTIQQLDFKSNNYAVDFYVWFRWKGANIDPSKTMEFMNRYALDDA